MERIYVTVRARPLSPEDAKSSPWKITRNSISFSNSSFKFDFDKIFGEDCKTREVYEARTKEIVKAAVSGFNGTVFAYGQTNSGKTHTMRGSASEPGVIPLAVRELFDIIQEVPDREFLLRMSYMEIYNEEINDLLAPEHRRLQIHESLEKLFKLQRGIFVAGLREEIVASPEQVLDFMEFGESHRHIGETNMNLHSSRSHTIFRMIIESRDKAGDEECGDSCDAVRVSVLNLVDLAGSERAAKTGAEGVRLKEGSHINKSLMTLGTVIKKLSEGAESQGGHVPYRDSKLTRILQPALGGNANTAIICNITLAQIHADETKSSLQFASRALQVTNCARVNEILTDAALLKRQKKEIEELRAKLQASHSEHLEEEILNLRNTLLQTEVERERIALELEEEKRAQAEREQRLEKKIKSLSSMVLYSSRDEIQEHPKKDKRRDTWCPGKLRREIPRKASNKLDSRGSVRQMRQEREAGPLVPFEELVTASSATCDISCKPKETHNGSISDDGMLPDPCTLMKVTNRRKVPQKKKSLPEENNEFRELQAEYEDLFLKFETQVVTILLLVFRINLKKWGHDTSFFPFQMQRILYDVEFDCLKRKLSETYGEDLDNRTQCFNSAAHFVDKNTHSVDTETILLIKQLEVQIKELKLENSARNLVNIDSAKEKNTHTMEKYEEENLSNLVGELLLEVQQATEEAQSLRTSSESISLVAEEALQSNSYVLNQFSDFKAFVCENSNLLRSVIDDYGMLIKGLRNRICELENEKLLLQSKSVDLQEQLQNAQNSEKSVVEQHDLELSELHSHIELLERELFSLQSSSLAKEKESIRKDLEKTRTKLKETESKLKNMMQEKTRLEGERANAEREIKRLQGQKALLERDICKRDSLAGKRRESVVDRPKAFDSKKARSQENIMQLTLQEDYKKLEVLAFEMEATIASLEEELAAANQEKEEILGRNESLCSELAMLTEKLDLSNTEIDALQTEIMNLRSMLEKSDDSHQKLETQLNLLVEEKEELAMQLTNGLLELEEERAVWSAKEKASIEAIKEKANVYNDEITLLSSELSKVKNELLSFRKEFTVLQEKLKCAEEHAQLEKRCSMEKSSEIDQLRHALEVAGSEKRASEELLKSKLDALSVEHSHACEEVQRLQLELATLSKEREDIFVQIKKQENEAHLSSDLQTSKSQLQFMTEERDRLILQIEELQGSVVRAKLIENDYDDKLLRAQHETGQLARRLAELEQKMHHDEVENSKERAKLRMRLHGTVTKLDAFCQRYKEAIDEQEFMHKKFEEASTKLKDRLASYGVEILNLKKQLAAASAQ